MLSRKFIQSFDGLSRIL